MITSRTIHKVLVTVPFGRAEIEWLRRAFAPAQFVHCNAKDAEAIAMALESVDVAVHAEDIDERFLAAPHLKWVHCDSAGLTRSARSEVFEKGLIVTGSAGRSATALAQHAFYFALALTYDAKRLFADQAARVWRGIPGYDQKLGLPGKTLGIVGFGNIGSEMAALGKAFGMTVIAYNRSIPAKLPANVDRFYAAERGDSLDPLIEVADVIMLAAPLTDATYHMFSADQFRRMKHSAFIINMARGELIDEEALLKALQNGEIAGAGLDVFTKEPLPADSPLWGAENVIITPHMTPAQPDKVQRSLDIIAANIENYRAGRPMLNAITPQDIFTPRNERQLASVI